MSDQIQETYLITQDEFRVLLQSAGCSKFYGFGLQFRKFSEDDVLRLMYQMVQKGFITSDGRDFYVNHTLSAMVSLLKQAEKVLMIADLDRELPPYCCYLGQSVLMVQWMVWREETMKLTVCQQQRLFELLADEGYFLGGKNFEMTLYRNDSGSRLCSLRNQTREGGLVLVYMEDAEERILPYTNQMLQEIFDQLMNNDNENENEHLEGRLL